MDNFICLNCQKEISGNKLIGTVNRNHCPFCLYSLHVDLKTPGDRKSSCHGLMKPVGLTFKHEGKDKWGKEKQGELMLVHQCTGCHKISINRIAGDDDPNTTLEVLTKSQSLEDPQIKLLTNADLPEIKKQLYGKEI